MRTLTTLLFLLSLCSLHLVFSAPYSFDFKSKCCSNTTTTRIPLKLIVTYWRVNSGGNCPLTSKKAIVFQTKAKRMFCVDPETPWVNTHMKSVDLRKNITESKP